MFRCESTSDSRGGNMKGAIVSLMVVATLFAAIVATPSTLAWDGVNRSTSVDFYSSNGGEASGGGLFSGGYSYPDRNKVEAFSNCIGTGFGASGWGYVWHIVECHATGYYKAELWGHYWGVGSAVGGADAFLRWDLRIEDVSSGTTQSTTIRQLEALGAWAFNEQNDFYATMIFYGYDTHTYRVGLYAYATSAGVVGSAIADGVGDQGAYFTHGRVSPYSSGGGGGGCIWSGSMVTMADGSTKKASQVKVGDEVLGYDVTNNMSVTEIVLSNSETHVSMVIDFNDGLLIATPMDQPIYARNGAFTGWVKDPLNLSIGWDVYCPLSDSWVDITSMEYKEGNYKVNDIRTDGPNNYLANGVLVDIKVQ